MQTKILSLNIWGGKKKTILLNFFKQQKSVDIICLQEVFSAHQSPLPQYEDEDSTDIFENISDLLPQHKGIFCPIIDRSYGLCILIKKSHIVTDHGRHQIHQCQKSATHGPFHDRYLQWVTINTAHYTYTVFNIHGLVNGQGKGDATERIKQIHAILAFAQEFPHPVLLAGDFNITLNTTCIDIIEKTYQNLIREYGVLSTRSHFYAKPDRFSDYIFLPKAWHCQEFAVPELTISDHLPLQCTFSIPIK